jgi:enolase
MVKKYKIKKLKAREILNSKNNPTVEVELETDFGCFLASVPSGTSKGKHEAVELRDKNGGVKKAIENVENIIFPAIKDENLRIS